MLEKELTEKESLQLITNMINQAKSNYQQRGSFNFLLWGWVVMLANLSHYCLDTFIGYEYPFVVWLVILPTAIVSIIYNRSQRKNALVTSHLGRLYGHLWLSIGVSVVIILSFMDRLGYNHNAVIILISGLGIYISGIMLRFRPLVVGALLLAVASVICFNVSVTDQYLVGGIGIFAGYLVPGYLLKSKER